MPETIVGGPVICPSCGKAYNCATETHFCLSVVALLVAKDAEIAQLRSENETFRQMAETMSAQIGRYQADNAALRERVAALEAFAKKWGTDAPLSERRTLHEASVAYRKAAGVFPDPDGVKAILDK